MEDIHAQSRTAFNPRKHGSNVEEGKKGLLITEDGGVTTIKGIGTVKLSTHKGAQSDKNVSTGAGIQLCGISSPVGGPKGSITVGRVGRIRQSVEPGVSTENTRL